MSKTVVSFPVHHVADTEPETASACGESERMKDALGNEFNCQLLCALKWEHVTCPACKAKKPPSNWVTTVKSDWDPFGPIAAVGTAKHLPLPIAHQDVEFSLKIVLGARPDELPLISAVWPVPPVTEEPAPAPEPEQPQRSEGDDLLDFFKGKA